MAFDYSKPHNMVDGVPVYLTTEEIAAKKASDDAWAAEQPKVLTKTAIKLLEDSVTPRRVREAILGTDNGWLETTNAQIAILRQQL